MHLNTNQPLIQVKEDGSRSQTHLTGWPQCARLERCVSRLVSSSTGAPQGAVLAALCGDDDHVLPNGGGQDAPLCQAALQTKSD